MRCSLQIVALVALGSCKPLIIRHTPKNNPDDPGHWESGKRFCNRLQSAASERANVNFGLGIAFGIAGAAATGTAAVMSGAISKPDYKDRVLEASMPVGAAAFFVLSKVFFSREHAASELAALASRNEKDSLDDNTALANCLDGRATWEESRDDAAQVARDLDKLSPQQGSAGSGANGSGNGSAEGSASTGSGT